MAKEHQDMEIDPNADPNFSREHQKRGIEMMARGYNPDNEDEAYAYRNMGFTDVTFISKISRQIQRAPTKIELPSQRPNDRQGRTYYDFLNDHRFRELLDADPYEARSGRVKLLRDYFPKFLAGGKQDLADYSPMEVNTLFQGMKQYAEKRLNKKA